MYRTVPFLESSPMRISMALSYEVRAFVERICSLLTFTEQSFPVLSFLAVGFIPRFLMVHLLMSRPSFLMECRS